MGSVVFQNKVYGLREEKKLKLKFKINNFDCYVEFDWWICIVDIFRICKLCVRVKCLMICGLVKNCFKNNYLLGILLRLSVKNCDLIRLIYFGGQKGMRLQLIFNFFDFLLYIYNFEIDNFIVKLVFII